MQEYDLEAMHAEANEMNKKIDELKTFIADMDLAALQKFEDFLKADTTGDATIAEQIKVVEARIKELTSAQ